MTRMPIPSVRTIFLSILAAAALVAVPTSCRPRNAVTNVATSNRTERSSASIIEPVRPPALSFEENRGQTDSSVKFLGRGRGYKLYLTATEAIMVADAVESLGCTDGPGRTSPAVRMELIGASPSRIEGAGTSATRSHYFIGSNSNTWRTNIPNYSKVRYANAYPGSDVIYHGQRNLFEYDLVISPGADLERVRLAIKGADSRVCRLA